MQGWSDRIVTRRRPALTLGSRIAQPVLPAVWDRARVAEWQTRRTQNPLPSRACGFKSHPGHRINTGQSVIHRPEKSELVTRLVTGNLEGDEICTYCLSLTQTCQLRARWGNAGQLASRSLQERVDGHQQCSDDEERSGEVPPVGEPMVD
jgi:hypothetical protein